MTDIARLGFSAETGPLTKATADLNALVPAAKRAETAVEGFNQEASSIGAATRAAASGLIGLNSGVGQVAAGLNGIDGAAAQAAAGISGVSRAALQAGTAMGTVKAAAAGVAFGMNTLGGSVTRVGNTFQQADAHIEAYKQHLLSLPPAADKARGSLDRLGAAANDNINRLQATPGNIAAQFQDIGVSAAGGMSPMLIALQQGTQLAAALGGGVGNLAAAFKQLISPVNILTIGLVGLAAALLQSVDWAGLAASALHGLADILAQIAPYAVAAAAALTLIYAPAIIGGIVSLTKVIYAMATGLLAVVGIPALVVVGLLAIVAAANVFRDELTQIFGFDIVAAAKTGINFIINGMIGAYRGIVAAWEFLPGALMDIFTRAFNAALRVAAAGVNRMLDVLNPLQAVLKMGGLDVGLSVKAPQLENGNAGMASQFGNVFTAAFKAEQGVDRFGKAVTFLQNKASDAAEWLHSLADGLSDSGKEAVKSSKSAKEAADKVDQLTKAAEQFVKTLKEEIDKIGLTTVEIKRYDVATAAAVAPTQKLTDEIIRLGKAWEVAYAKNELVDQGKRLTDLQQEIKITQELAEMRVKAYKTLTGADLKTELDEIELAGKKARNIADAAKDAAEYQRLAEGALDKGNIEAAGLWQNLAKGAEYSAELKNNSLDTELNLKQSTEAADRFNDALSRTLSILDDILGTNLAGLFDGLKEFGGLFEGNSKLTKMFENFSKGAAVGGAVGGKGGAIGGGLANAAFDEFAGKGLKEALGAFGGPLASIAGGIIGGIIGGLMKSTPRASATVSIIAGEAMDTAITGSSGKLKAMAGEMANSVIGGLEELASALGAQLTGDAKVSIGMRKGNYRVDTTGSGTTKTSKGAQDFGEDKAAAIAFALQDAIKDGVLKGLSASMTTLIQGDGDLQSQLTKALSFKSVFDELAKNDDPVKFAQDEITRWHDSMASIFEEAGATSEELAELERLTGIKRTEAAKQAGTDLVQVERDRKNLLIKIAELEGRSTEALAMTRQMEKAAADATLGPLYDRIYALEDEASAAAALKLIADERLGLEARLMQIQGDTVGLRQRELDALDPTNRALLQLIFSLEDAAAATLAARSIYEKQVGIEAEIMTLQGNAAGALRVQRELELNATEAGLRSLLTRKYALEDEAAATEALKAIADERYGLETQLLTLQGDTVALRQRELAVLNPANQSIQQLIWSLEDQAVATQAAAKAAEELAAKQKAIADERYGLEDRYLNLIGDTTALRKRELDALLSDDNRAYLQMIFDTEDAMAAAAKAAEEARAAQEAHNNALKDAKDLLLDTYKRERGELQATADTFRKFMETIREFRYSLSDSINPVEGFRLIAKQYNEALHTSSNDASQYINAAKNYIDAAKARSHNVAEFSQVIGRVRADASTIERGAGSRVYTAERQMMLMDEQVGALIEIHDAVVTLPEAIANFISVRDEGVFSNIMDTQTEMLREEVQELRADNSELMGRLAELNESSAANISRLYNLFDDVIVGEGLQVTNIPGKPIVTEAV